MMKNLVYLFYILWILTSCSRKDKKNAEIDSTPIVSNNGQTIFFPDTNVYSFFKTEKVNSYNIIADYTTPGKIAATVVSSQAGASQNVILFENADLASNYTQLIQHQINISQIRNINIKHRQIELDRIRDLQQHGAATGQDLLNAETALSMEQTNLDNERAALIEHEARLQSGGFNPGLLLNAKSGTSYLICDIPENQIEKMKHGSSCKIIFTAFPNETFTGLIDDVADVLDNATRMVKLRISINNSSSKLKAGMFANVSFGLNEGNFISISKNSLVTVQGKNYVFAKKGSRSFERKEIQVGQQIDERIIVFSGLTKGEEVALEGVIQLKGLSFGY
jgi:membrane fusion protein, heavy metal efflux system